MLSRLSFLPFALLTALSAESATIYSSLLSPPSASGGKLVGPYGQVFEPAVEIPASLQTYTGIEVSVGILGPVGRRFQVNLRSDNAGVPGSILASAEGVAQQSSSDAFFNGWNGYPTVMLPGVTIAANTSYWLSVSTPPGQLGVNWAFATSSSTDLPAAGVLVDSVWMPEPFSRRGGFEIRGEAVPEPSTTLTCVAVALVIGARHRRQVKSLRLHQPQLLDDDA